MGCKLNGMKGKKILKYIIRRKHGPQSRDWHDPIRAKWNHAGKNTVVVHWCPDSVE